MAPQEVAAFQEKVWEYYRIHARHMPWRERPLPYYVLVSELMLQQTQVSRVIPKFNHFIRRFPTIERLVDASLAEVLSEWSGLGYNRRAKFLHEAAKRIASQGSFPRTMEELVSLPGIGPNTAAAILNYAFEIATPFVETNIRTAFFHELDEAEGRVADRRILEWAGRTMDSEHPREWFYALMDYGAMLKVTAGARLDRSMSYKKQSPLKGSVREVRGRILKVLAGIGSVRQDELRQLSYDDERFDMALEGLERDGLVVRLSDGRVGLTGMEEAS